MDQSRIVYVGFSHHKNMWAVMSFLIRWWESPKTWNPITWFSLFFASHVFIIFPGNKRRPFYMVSEAAGSSVRYMSQQNFEGHAEISRIYQMKFPKPVYDKVKTYSEQYAGTPYALMENIGIVVARIFKRKRNYWIGEDRQKCSELVMRNAVLRLEGVNMGRLQEYFLEDYGRVLCDDIDLIGVRDCYEILQSLVKRNIISEVPRFAPLKVG